MVSIRRMDSPPIPSTWPSVAPMSTASSLADFLAPQGSGLLDAPNHAPVGLDDAVKAHLVAQQILQGWLRCRAAVVSSAGGWVIGHHGGHARLDSRIIGLQVDFRVSSSEMMGPCPRQIHLRASAEEVLVTGDIQILVEAAGAMHWKPSIWAVVISVTRSGSSPKGFPSRGPSGSRGDIGIRRKRRTRADGHVLPAGPTSASWLTSSTLRRPGRGCAG